MGAFFALVLGSIAAIGLYLYESRQTSSSADGGATDAGGTGAGGAPPSVPVQDSTLPDQISEVPFSMPEMVDLQPSADGITSDPSTWPSGDVIWNVAQAIAHAEGADVSGDAPDNLNNPGDLSPGDEHGQATIGSAQYHGGSYIIHFATKQDGWNALYKKLAAIAAGQSHVYSPDMTWVQIAQKWAGNWQNWVKNVTRTLNVDENSKFSDYVVIN